MSNLTGLGLDVIACTTPVEAISRAEIIITYSAGKQCAIIFSDNMIGAGVHINAIGGGCLGKTILHSNILRRYNIFVEYPPETRIKGEIQYLPEDHPVTEIWKVEAGTIVGLKNDQKIMLVDSVGFATEDFTSLRHVLKIFRKQSSLSG